MLARHDYMQFSVLKCVFTSVIIRQLGWHVCFKMERKIYTLRCNLTPHPTATNMHFMGIS